MHCSRHNPDGVLRKGAWSKEEDILLKKCVETFGEGRWHLVPLRAGLNRCRKSCRLRWVNYLSPDIKRGYFSTDEIDLLVRLHKLLGNRWSLIAGRIPGRTANDVKNYYNTHILKMSISSMETNKSFNKTKIIKPKPHNMAKLAVSNKHQQPLISKEPQLQSRGNGTTTPIQTGPTTGLSEFSTGFWEMLGFGI